MTERGCTVIFNLRHAGRPVVLQLGVPPLPFPAIAAFSSHIASPSRATTNTTSCRSASTWPVRGVFGLGWTSSHRDAGEFRPADQTVLLPWNGEKIGMSICYEVVFPSEVAALVRQGATMLVTITNDAWYGDTSAPWQHFRAGPLPRRGEPAGAVARGDHGRHRLRGPRRLGPSPRSACSRGHPARPEWLGRAGASPTFSRAPWLVPLLSDAGGPRSARLVSWIPCGTREKEPSNDRLRSAANESIPSPTSSPTSPGVFFEQGELERELSEIDHQMQAPGFWDNPGKNAPLLQKRRDIERRLETLNRLRADADELATWRELLDEGEADPEFDRFLLDRITAELGKLELDFKLSGPDDDKNALLAIHPGAGGTESQDWAEMLLRMYLRYAEQHGFEVELLDRRDGEEAGLKSATLAVRGPHAYGYLKSEHGVHRLVRISPYDFQARRHNLVRLGGRAARGRRRRGDRDQRQGPEGRRLPLLGGRRPARQTRRSRPCA